MTSLRFAQVQDPVPLLVTLDKHLEIEGIVYPKLVEYGKFLVGLDIIGNRLMEINVFSP